MPYSDSVTISREPGLPPRVWLLMGYKAGDNTQVLALAEALNWPFERKKMVYRPWELLTNRLLGVTLAGIDRSASSPLRPPWPDLIITAGRRNEPVARWIHRQSGGQCRLVHIGRPWSALRCFDLIITTPQYFLPQAENILHNRLPLHRVREQSLQQAAREWMPSFSHLTRPYLAVLLGGDSGPYVFTKKKATRLGQLVNARARQRGASVLYSGSARTPAQVFEVFQQQITVPCYGYRWGSNEPNPYLAFLAIADELIVTGESMSMLTEACASGKPLSIFDLDDAATDAANGVHRTWWSHAHNFRYKPFTHRLAMRLGPIRMRRDIGNIQRQLVASGRAVWLGQDFPRNMRVELPDDTQRAARRIRSWFD